VTRRNYCRLPDAGIADNCQLYVKESPRLGLSNISPVTAAVGQVRGHRRDLSRRIWNRGRCVLGLAGVSVDLGAVSP